MGPPRLSRPQGGAKGGEGMERDRQYAWDRKHMRTVGTKLRRRDYERLRKVCEDEGFTVYALLQELVRLVLEQKG